MGQTRGQERNDGHAKSESDGLARAHVPQGHDDERSHRESPVKEEQDFSETVDRLLSECGGPPLNGLHEENLPRSEVVMAHILNALLSSTRIPHEKARSALNKLLDAKYNDLQVLGETTWYERTDLLTAGGYARYRERMANFLGDLLKLMKEKYGEFTTRLPSE